MALIHTSPGYLVNLNGTSYLAHVFVIRLPGRQWTCALAILEWGHEPGACLAWVIVPRSAPVGIGSDNETTARNVQLSNFEFHPALARAITIKSRDENPHHLAVILRLNVVHHPGQRCRARHRREGARWLRGIRGSRRTRRNGCRRERRC